MAVIMLDIEIRRSYTSPGHRGTVLYMHTSQSRLVGSSGGLTG